MGGQTALNCALDLAQHGVLDKYGVELIGASRRRSTRPRTAEVQAGDDQDRPGLGAFGHRPQHGRGLGGAAKMSVGFPIIRPASRWAAPAAASPTTPKSSRPSASAAWKPRPTNELLIEESLLGWKEFEMEVVRDKADNCIIVCSIENLDPMGVHTGDSITVAPAQTLTDREYQILRNASHRVLREIGVDTGGSNVQFAINPDDGPHGRDRDEPAREPLVGAGLQGHRLPDRQDRRQAGGGLHAGRTAQRHHRRRHAGQLRAQHRLRGHQDSAFRLREVPAADSRLTTQMKSVGEVMAIGRTFQESFQKALRGLEVGVDGMNEKTQDREVLEKELGEPGPERIWYVGDAFAAGMDAGRGLRADQDRPLVPGADRGDRQDRTRTGQPERSTG
jgi:carbamoyl-phosphate synthase large subunit